MNQRIFVTLLTVVVFVAGYAARVWTEHGRPVPPPPPGLTQEYARAGLNQGGTSPQPSGSTSQLDRAKLVTEIEQLRPQIETYRCQVEEIDTAFEQAFLEVLNPEQRQKREADVKRWTESAAKRMADRTPLSDQDIARERERPLTSIYGMVTVTPRLERLTKEYTLDEEQQAKVRALLSLRKNKFLALLDSTPHPSIRLSRLAPLVDRVAAPPQ